MTEPVNQLSANTNTWRDLLGTVNQIATIISTKVASTSNTVVGDIGIDGIVTANELYDGLNRVVTVARQVNTGTGLTGGGALSNNITIAFNANTNTLLGKANTALQTSDFSGKIGLQNAVTVSQIEVISGTPNNTTILHGDGTWKTLPSVMLNNQSTLKWMSRGIGEYYAVDDSMVGADIPPTNDSRFRYVKLTAGLTGGGQYNDGILISESISGSAPLVVATATINLVGSPINGESINLINTEGRFVRASTSAGTVQNDQMQGHEHDYVSIAAGSSIGSGTSYTGGTFNTVNIVSDGTNGTPRTGTETRSKNIGVTYFMRIM